MEEVVCTYPCKVGTEDCRCREDSDIMAMPNDLTREELELVSEIVWIYRDDRDMTQHEWAEIQLILDKLDDQIAAVQ